MGVKGVVMGVDIRFVPLLSLDQTATTVQLIEAMVAQVTRLRVWVLVPADELVEFLGDCSSPEGHCIVVGLAADVLLAVRWSEAERVWTPIREADGYETDAVWAGTAYACARRKEM